MAAAFKRQENNLIPSSSPAFATPAHPIRPPPRERKPISAPNFKPAISTVLPILLPPPSLRPLAFRTFTKKHNLTLSSPALQSLATFIGRHCGSGWREEGTAEKVLEDVAKTWKANGGSLIVDDGSLLKNILKTLEGCMSGGRIVQTKGTKTGPSRQNSFAFGAGDAGAAGAAAVGADQPHRPSLDHHGSSFGLSALQVQEVEEEEEDETQDPRAWLKVVSAFEQPRLTFDVQKKHFDVVTTKPSLLPSPAHKTTLFRDRYNLIHQRLLRNEAFQAPPVNQRSRLSRTDSTTIQQFYKITPISNLLGRNGSSHVLLGLLVVTPSGTLALSDLTGSITLDLQHAKALQGDNSAWFCPGMILLLEGVYEEEYAGAGSSGLGTSSGVGGTIGGKFIAFSIGGPPSEKRNISLGITDIKQEDISIGGGFGWTDFLGLGSEKAMGTKMRRLEQRLLGSGTAADPDRKKMVIMSEVNLDDPSALEALRSVLKIYSAEAEPTPLSFVLMGNFVSHPVMAGGGSGGSIEYKEYFNDLAALLIDFPSLLRDATWVFVPGDNDPWASAFSAGASTAIPRQQVPQLFTSRVKKAFAQAKSELGAKKDGIDGEAIWTSNPARVSLFGSAHEMLFFRDDMSSRLRRTAITFGQAAREHAADDDDNNDEAMDTDNDPLAMSGALGDQAIDHAIEAMDVTAPDPAPVPAPQDPQPQQQAAAAAAAEATTTAFARKLILSLVPQSHLSPFPLPIRPVHWDYGGALSLYPLPHTLVLADAEAPPFAITFEGCHVISPGRLVREEGRVRRVGWVEYDVLGKRGVVRESWF